MKLFICLQSSTILSVLLLLSSAEAAPRLADGSSGNDGSEYLSTGMNAGSAGGEPGETDEDEVFRDNFELCSNPQASENGYFLVAGIDGNERVFNLEAFMFAEMRTFPVNGLYELWFGASRPGESGEGIVESLTVDFDLETPITVGVYNEPEDLPVGFLHAFLGYSNVDLSDYIGETLFVTDINEPVSFLEITALSEDRIAGNFSGIVQNPLVSDSISITDGEFCLELIVHDE